MNSKDFMVKCNWVITEYDCEPLKTTVGDSIDLALPGGYAEMGCSVVAIDEEGMEINTYLGTFRVNLAFGDNNPTILAIEPGRKWSHFRTIHLDSDIALLKIALEE